MVAGCRADIKSVELFAANAKSNCDLDMHLWDLSKWVSNGSALIPKYEIVISDVCDNADWSTNNSGVDILPVIDFNSRICSMLSCWLLLFCFGLKLSFIIPCCTKILCVTFANTSAWWIWSRKVKIKKRFYKKINKKSKKNACKIRSSPKNLSKI